MPKLLRTSYCIRWSTLSLGPKKLLVLTLYQPCTDRRQDAQVSVLVLDVRGKVRSDLSPARSRTTTNRRQGFSVNQRT